MKNCKIALLLLFMSPSLGFSQEADPLKHNDYKDNLSLNIGYGVGGYGIFDVLGLADQNSVINSEIGGVLTAEIGIEVKLSENFKLFTGLHYNRIGMEFSIDSINYGIYGDRSAIPLYFKYVLTANQFLQSNVFLGGYYIANNNFDLVGSDMIKVESYLGAAVGYELLLKTSSRGGFKIGFIGTADLDNRDGPKLAGYNIQLGYVVHLL